LDTPIREGICNFDIGGRACNCDGRTQWHSFKGETPEEVVALANKAKEAGYEVFAFDGESAAVRPINSRGEKLDYWIATVYSSTLPPVATRAEFEQRIGLQ
jgi:hypothetical protein